MSDTIAIVVTIACAVVGFIMGSVIGYGTGRADGYDEAAEYYEGKRRNRR